VATNLEDIHALHNDRIVKLQLSEKILHNKSTQDTVYVNGLADWDRWSSSRIEPHPQVHILWYSHLSTQ